MHFLLLFLFFMVGWRRKCNSSEKSSEISHSPGELYRQERLPASQEERRLALLQCIVRNAQYLRYVQLGLQILLCFLGFFFHFPPSCCTRREPWMTKAMYSILCTHLPVSGLDGHGWRHVVSREGHRVRVAVGTKGDQELDKLLWLVSVQHIEILRQKLKLLNI